VDLPFPGMELVNIEFLSKSDFCEFKSEPTKFFNSVKERTAMKNENMIYQRCVLLRTRWNCSSKSHYLPADCKNSVVQVSQTDKPTPNAILPIRASISTSINASKEDPWCDLRIYESKRADGNRGTQNDPQGWDTTRRIVLSSTAHEKPPWCRSYCKKGLKV